MRSTEGMSSKLAIFLTELLLAQAESRTTERDLRLRESVRGRREKEKVWWHLALTHLEMNNQGLLKDYDWWVFSGVVHFGPSNASFSGVVHLLLGFGETIYQL